MFEVSRPAMSDRSATRAPCSRPIRMSTSLARTALAVFSGPQNLLPERPNTVSTAEINTAASNRVREPRRCSERPRGESPIRCKVLSMNSSEVVVPGLRFCDSGHLCEYRNIADVAPIYQFRSTNYVLEGGCREKPAGNADRRISDPRAVSDAAVSSRRRSPLFRLRRRTFALLHASLIATI